MTGCFTTDEQILNGALNETNKNPCKSDAVLSKNRPCSVYLNNDTTGVLGCGWPTLNTALRIVFSLLSVAICVVVFVFVFWKKNRGAVFISLLLLLAAAGFIYLTYLDVSDVDASNKWCKDKMNGTHFFKKPSDVQCLYSKFIGTTVTEPFAALFFILATAMAIVYTCNSRKAKSNPDTNSVDFDMPSRDIGPRHDDDDEGDGKPAQTTAATSGQSGMVNFDEEQSKRFTPINQTEMKENRTLQQQAKSSQTKDHKHSVAPVAPGEIDFDAEAASGDDTQPVQSTPSYLQSKPSAPPAPHPAKHNPPAHAPPKRAPPTSSSAARRAPTAPPPTAPPTAPPTKGGMVDFDAIAEEP